MAAILIVGTLLLGNGELKDLSLVLFVGMLSGTYSSICIATPVLGDLKERQPQYRQLARQVALREARGRAAQRRAKAAQSITVLAGADGSDQPEASGQVVTAAQPGASRQPASRSGSRSASADLPHAGGAGAEAADSLDEEVVPAGQPVGGEQPRGATPGPPGLRQQAVRRPAAKRRPSGKKKRR